VEAEQFRQYQDIANWDDGVGLHETGQIIGEGSLHPTPKRCIGMVPLDGMLEYYRDLDLVIKRLSHASSLLVANYNALTRKKSLEWKDLICRQDWIGKGGRKETTLFQLELSTYNFCKMGRVGPEGIMKTTDVKVRQQPPPGSRSRVSNGFFSALGVH
jgi:hypothetical protein